MEKTENMILQGDESSPYKGVFNRGVEMVMEVFHARELLFQLILRDIRIRYKQAALGFAWAIFMPLLIIASGVLVKFAMSFLSQQPLDVSSIAGMGIKAMVWAFFAGCITFSSNVLSGNINLVTKIYFPREVLPLAAVFTQVFDSFIGALGMSVLLFLFFDITFSWTILWLIPLVFILICLSLALALFISCANVFYRDIKYIVQVIITFGIFFTPVFYEPIMFGGAGCKLMMLNPLTPIMEGMRLSVIGPSRLEQQMMAKTEGVSGEGNLIAKKSENARASVSDVSEEVRKVNKETQSASREEILMTKKSESAETSVKEKSVGINLLKTFEVDGVRIWSPYYLLYSFLFAVGGLMLTWWNFHRLEFILPEYI
ncbi:MAG: ABC transporter permease [Planctomycetia bacterium]|nr:ABC transporter permease [Planctomycetia bacterium]